MTIETARQELDAATAERESVLAEYQKACDRIRQAERAVDAARKAKSEIARVLDRAYQKESAARDAFISEGRRVEKVKAE